MREDGGPAFPGKYHDSGWLGMSMRDYFAAACLISGKGIFGEKAPASEAEVAERCYKMADAMLVERTK